jgi:hypothetical protein
VTVIHDVLAATERGWSVFPLRPGTKLPAVDRWAERANSDRARIERYWARRPADNYGIACGPSGLLVVDLDVHDLETANGVTSWCAVLDRAGETAWSTTFEVATPSGGVHVYYRPASGDEDAYRNTAGRLGSGIDTRASGGFVVGPGSHDERGPWEVWADAPVAAVPSWLEQLLSCERRLPRDGGHADGGHRHAPEPGVRWHGLVGKMAAAPEGERNSVLHWCACRMAEDGAPVEALDALHLAAVRAGLAEREIEATIRSAYGGSRG